MSQSKSENKSLGKSLINQAFTNWINPELEKRKKLDTLPHNFSLNKAQVIFSVDGKKEVRINNEIRARIAVKTNRDIKAGEAIFQDDVEDVKSILLTEEEIDFGHITLVRLKNKWFISFSFLYDISKSKQFLRIALDFLKSGRNDYENKNYRPMVESLSITAENLAKSRIYLHPDKVVRKAKRHKTIQTRLNIWANTSNIITKEQKDVYNKLLKLRDDARYNPKFKVNQKEALDLLNTLEKMSNEISKYYPY